MIAKLEDKTIAVLEMVLDVIQMYSKDLNLKNVRKQEEYKKEKGTNADFFTRLEFIKDDFSAVFAKGITKTCDFVKEYKLLSSLESYYEYVDK